MIITEDWLTAKGADATLLKFFSVRRRRYAVWDPKELMILLVQNKLYDQAWWLLKALGPYVLFVRCLEGLKDEIRFNWECLKEVTNWGAPVFHMSEDEGGTMVFTLSAQHDGPMTLPLMKARDLPAILGPGFQRASPHYVLTQPHFISWINYLFRPFGLHVRIPFGRSAHFPEVFIFVQRLKYGCAIYGRSKDGRIIELEMVGSHPSGGLRRPPLYKREHYTDAAGMKGFGDPFAPGFREAADALKRLGEGYGLFLDLAYDKKVIDLRNASSVEGYLLNGTTYQSKK